MAIFANVKNYFANKRRERLRGDLQVLASQGIYFNPKHIVNADYIDPQREFSLRVQENYVWFTGKPRLIRMFYMTNSDLIQSLSFFWQQAPDWHIKKHAGLANTVSDKMPKILFGGGFQTEIEVYKIADGKISDDLDEELSKKAKNQIETLMGKCEFSLRIRTGATTESWSGHLFCKYSYDLSLSEYPILEIADIRNVEIEKVRGITKAIIFKNWFKYGSNEYVHKERYTTDERGFAKIENKVYKLNHATKDEIEVPLEIMTKAYGLNEPIEPEFVFEGVKGMLAFEKPNKLPNPEFLDSVYGASDYCGAISSLDGLDEVLSEIFAEVRNNKTIRYVPQELLQRTEDGDVVGINNFVRNYIAVKTLFDQNAKNEINITPIEDKMASLQKKWQIGIATACTKMGVSPVSLGIPGLESIDAAADSQQERNKATLETRADKHKLWKPFLENMLLQLLVLNSWMQKKFPDIQKQEDRLNIDFDNCNVLVKFGDYIVEKQSEKIATWGGAKAQGVASTREAVKNIHPDWSDSKLDEEVNLIRYEQGMALDNPQNLPELTGFEEEEDDEEEKKQGDGGSVDDMINKIERDKQKQENKTE